ncbi:roadblock/LC7 domain-containing protein [Streptomyces sp. NBC_00669]|uniref:roadblock/LC7 domain-containing protein n=1 Tax=unclassified Streptomyces TaxID=2593676 RepID=UPI002E30E8B6|nr:roadblock/LC7 domain-containing protein [Streptomyces sp. NBC_00669]
MTVGNGLAWLLDDLTKRVPHVQHALVLSNDGLVTGASGDLDRPTAEHLAAVSSGFHSLAKGAGRQFGTGGVRQTMIEFEEGFLFVTAAGDGSCLSVLSGMDADIGQVAYEMTRLVRRVGEHLGVAPRQSGTTRA